MQKWHKGFILNLIEWYDFAVFSSFVGIFGKIICSQNSVNYQIFYGFILMAMGFLSRPLGALYFGYISDTQNREFAVIETLYIMTIGTICLAITPTYNFIGLFSILWFSICRFVQGFALGGNYGSVSVWLINNLNKNLNFYMSCNQVGFVSGILLGEIVVAIFKSYSSEFFFTNYAWRLCLLLSSIPSIYILQQSGKSVKITTSKFIDSISSVYKSEAYIYIKNNPLKILQCISIISLDMVGFYMWFIYIPQHNWSSNGDIFKLNILHKLLLCLFLPICGVITDKISNHIMLRCVAISFIIMSIFTPWNSFYFSIISAIIMAGCYSSMMVWIVKQFPSNIQSRVTGLIINLTALFCGSLTPIISSYFTIQFQSNISLGIIIGITGILALLSLSKNE